MNNRPQQITPLQQLIADKRSLRRRLREEEQELDEGWATRPGQCRTFDPDRTQPAVFSPPEKYILCLFSGKQSRFLAKYNGQSPLLPEYDPRRVVDSLAIY